MAETFEHKYVDVDGIETHYLEAGDPKEQTIVLIHGGGSSSCAELNYGAAIGPLARDLHVIALDVVGYGRTPCPSPQYYPAEAQGSFIIRFMEELDIVAHVGGNSLGGWMANYVAHESPLRVKTLIVINSRGATATPDDRYVVWDDVLRDYRPPRRPWTKAKSISKKPPTRDSVRKKMEKNFLNKDLVTEEMVDLVLEIGELNHET
ncbi:MAG: alpha/beta fold hydrolase, partial [Clostridia bacterium]